VQTKLVGILSLACLIFTMLWLVFLIVSIAGAGPLIAFEQVLVYVAKLDMKFYLTYANAGLVTVSAVLLFAALYSYYLDFAQNRGRMRPIRSPGIDKKRVMNDPEDEFEQNHQEVHHYGTVYSCSRSCQGTLHCVCQFDWYWDAI
jgi:energy-coupling factor transporter transmembrane protein EcfT